ncbi:MAG: ATP-binding protein [Tepidisphaerales bacterium]
MVAIIGARQVGKTTLARELSGGRSVANVFDLERPADLARLADPMLALEPLRHLVVLDEIQRRPEIFPVLRVLADRPRTPARFLVLGSASPELLRQSSESLAGRIHYHQLGGLSLTDAGVENAQTLWCRGGFPRSYLASSDSQSFRWRRDFVRTFLERDLPQLGITVASETLLRFWSMLAHYHGQIWNAAEFARSFGVSESTVRSYLDKLGSALVVRQLRPWHENLGKRQVKSPKIYLSDTGLLHALLNIRSMTELEGHPKVGASWEGFVIEQFARAVGVEPDECYFWATHAGAELDLLIVRGDRRIGVEVKRTTAPSLTPSMRAALADLRLSELVVVHAGQNTFKLAADVRAVALSRLLDDIRPLR